MKMTHEHACEYCGKDLSDCDWGDVRGASVCQTCIDNDPHVKLIVAEMEARLDGYDNR